MEHRRFHTAVSVLIYSLPICSIYADMCFHVLELFQQITAAGAVLSYNINVYYITEESVFISTCNKHII